jgi:hypothetical protein
MKKIIIMGTAASLVAIMTSCGTYKETTTRNMNANVTKVVSEPKIMDYSVDLTKKATGAAEGKLAGKLSFKKWLTKDYYVQRALVEAINSSNSDFIFEPVIDAEFKKKYISVKIVGYPAKYTKISDMNYKDTTQMKYYYNSLENSDALNRKFGTDGQKYTGGVLKKIMNLGK